jgi:putative phosphoribosyl transferase
MKDTAARLIRLTAGSAKLEGMLTVPPDPLGTVLFAHGSGSSRHSPRNTFVARELQARGLATLLVDLLDPLEELDVAARFDIELLASRLAACARYLGGDPQTAERPLGLFGASTGAAAALRLAASQPTTVRAVVSRGGRPDLAGQDALGHVLAPTLLIVGERDVGVIELNERAFARLHCPKQLAIVPDATHLFEEPGALQRVAGLAGDWFLRHLAALPQPPASHGARQA